MNRDTHDGKFQPYDQPPVQKDGYTFVPLRGIFESLGAKLEVNGNTIRAVRGDTVIEHTIGEKTAIINGQSTTLAMPSLVINGRTLVPLRFVSEALGAQVEWSSFHRIVYVGTTDRNKIATLDEAVLSNDYFEVKRLLEEGMDTNPDFVLLKSIDFKNYDITKLLLEHGADINQIDRDSNAFNLLYNEKNILLTEEQELEYTALLLSYKPDFKALDNGNIDLTINYPIVKGKVKVVEKLLKAGANPNQTGKVAPNNQMTVLQFATENNNKKLVKLLRKYGATN